MQGLLVVTAMVGWGQPQACISASVGLAGCAASHREGEKGVPTPASLCRIHAAILAVDGQWPAYWPRSGIWRAALLLPCSPPPPTLRPGPKQPTVCGVATRQPAPIPDASLVDAGLVLCWFSTAPPPLLAAAALPARASSPGPHPAVPVLLQQELVHDAGVPHQRRAPHHLSVCVRAEPADARQVARGRAEAEHGGRAVRQSARAHTRVFLPGQPQGTAGNQGGWHGPHGTGVVVLWGNWQGGGPGAFK